MRKLLTLLFMSLFVGTGSVMADNMRAYSTGISDSNTNISYNSETKTWTWTTTYSNQLTIFSFTAGTLSKFSTINWVSSESTVTGDGNNRYRILFYAGNSNLGGIYPVSDGSKSINLSEIQKDGASTGTYLSSDELNTVTAIKISGSNKSSGSTKIDLDGIYLEADHGIGTTSDWETLSTVVNAGLTKVNVEMTADVNAGSTMVGTSSNPYQGTFDGAGHTLTFTYSDASGEYIAPFQYAQDATFNDLLTAGSISAKNMLGGIIANACGACTLNNCGSTMTLAASNGTSDSRVGGLVARCADNSTPAGNGITLNYCAYNGSISSSNNQMCGFIGWVRTVTATLNYCLAAPTSDVTGGGQNVASTGNGGTVNATNTYYTTKFGSSSQATAATAVQLESGSLAYDLNTSNTGTLFFGQENLNKSNIKLPMLTSDASKKVVKVKINGMSTAPYVNPGGAVPNPCRFGKLGFKLSDSDDQTLQEMPAESSFIYGTESGCSELKTTTGMYCIKLSAAASTLVLPFDCESLPDGITAYDITYTSGDAVTAKSVSKITANKPVLINGTAGNTYKFTGSFGGTYSGTDATNGKTNENGALTGIYVNANASSGYNPIAYVPADSYVLQKGEHGLGFYKVAGANKIKITSFRAYLTPGSESRAFFGIDFDDETTGIESVKDSGVKVQDSEAYYDLSGRRVVHPTKGLYIVNGKKVVIK